MRVGYSDLSVRIIGLVGWTALIGFVLLASGAIDAKTSVNASAIQPVDDSL